MKQSKELKINLEFDPFISNRGFICTMEGEALAGAYYRVIITLVKGQLIILPFLPFSTPKSISPGPIRRVITPEGVARWEYSEDFAPVAKAIESYKPTKEESAKIEGFFFYFPPEVFEKGKIVKETPGDRLKLEPGALEYFGDLLKRILKKAGYRPYIEKGALVPKRWKDTTALLSPQRFFSADKTGNILAELIGFAKQKEIPLDYDTTGQNVIGMKVTLSIPGRRAIEEDAQLTFSFGEKDGFKVIPINDLDKHEVQEEIRRTFDKIEKGICKEMDPLALRVKDALLCLAQDKGWKWSFYLDENELLDLLFERDRKGYHSKGNRDNVAKRLILLHQSTWSYAIQIGGNTLGIKDAPYIILNPDGKAFVELTEKKGKRKVRYDFQSVQISKAYQSLFSKGKYLSQHDRVALKLQQASYSLYKYISQRWRIGWQDDQGIYEWLHNDVLEEAGVAVPTGAHKARDLQRIEGYYEDMKRKGFLKDYGRRFQHKDPFKDKWFWEAPDEVKDVYRQMGVEYEREREIRELKREKKRLKLEGEVIDLQAKAK